MADDPGVTAMSHGDHGSTSGDPRPGEHALGERPADGEVARRRLAAGLALGLGVAKVVVPIVQILLLTDAVPAGTGAPGRFSFLPITLAEAAPWCIGAVLLGLQRVRLATAVLVTAAAIDVVFTLPLGVGALTGATTGLRVVEFVVPVGFTAVAIATAGLVWSCRTEPAPEPHRAVPRFVGVAAGLVALTAVFVTIVPLAPASRTPVAGWFPTTVGSGQFADLPIALWTVLPVVLLVGCTIVAFRTGGDVAGAILLTIAGPRLVGEITTHVVNVTAWDGMITPVGALVLVGLLGMVGGGLHLLGPTGSDAPDGPRDPARPMGPRPATPSVAGG